MRQDSIRPVTTDLSLGAPPAQARLVVEKLPADGWARDAARHQLANALNLPATSVGRMLSTLPARFALTPGLEPTAASLISALGELGAFARQENSLQHGALASEHSVARTTSPCERCRKAGSAARQSRRAHGQNLCERCHHWRRLSRGFFLVRVSVLLTVLLLLSVWGYRDAQSRAERTRWDRTLSVALVLATNSPVDPHSIQLLEARLGTLEQKLAEEFARYRSGPPPFCFVLHGPTSAAAPPKPPQSSDLAALALHSIKTWWYLFAIDYSLDIPISSYDSRIYVVADPPLNKSLQLVEGYGEHGGRVGIVQVQLSDAMVDTVLTVAVHELLHTLGANDKYDAGGNALIPFGLAEPTRQPLFPQDHVEIMARNRPLNPTTFVNLDSLHELKVGPSTALEIGWLDESRQSAQR